MDEIGTATMIKCYDVRSNPYPSGYGGIRNYSTASILKCNMTSVFTYLAGLNIHPTFYLINTIEMEGAGIETDPYVIVN